MYEVPAQRLRIGYSKNDENKAVEEVVVVVVMSKFLLDNNSARQDVGVHRVFCQQIL